MVPGTLGFLGEFFCGAFSARAKQGILMSCPPPLYSSEKCDPGKANHYLRRIIQVCRTSLACSPVHLSASPATLALSVLTSLTRTAPCLVLTSPLLKDQKEEKESLTI